VSADAHPGRVSTAALTAIVARARTLAADVRDPEIPVISIGELGVLRDVQAVPHGAGFVVEVSITPTYNGCPAMDQIRDDILDELDAHDIPARVRTVLAPAWTTDWMSDAARNKLRAYGIAPPGARSSQPLQVVRPQSTASQAMAIATEFVANNPAFPADFAQKGMKNTPKPPEPVPCPRCDSIDTVLVSAFGSTACKSQLRCLHCKEPFDHFKPH
jgi:ring-1,2-phenylacetyl-CoA epoxidase subunit PaaD